jgi:mRNA-degrading endonuclease RelE of RelBE toxin-antitoxin system
VKRVLFRPEAVKDLDRLQDRDRDLVEKQLNDSPEREPET